MIQSADLVMGTITKKRENRTVSTQKSSAVILGRKKKILMKNALWLMFSSRAE